jgi:uncharacterized caspase-like protein
VVVDSLINNRATKENIELLRDKFMKTSVDDQIILFISGHGLLDENLDFYFATYDIDFKNPATRGYGTKIWRIFWTGYPPVKNCC